MKWEKLLSLDTQAEKEEEPDVFQDYPISELEDDYKSIISSVAFRRLQDKTQVFPLDKSDFVRTRLTHSMEVSTIARQLGVMITTNKTKYLQEDFRNNPEIVSEVPIILSCAGLLHDIGNPPFGHFGEVVIGEWFQKEFQKDTFQYKGQPVKKQLTKQMRMDLEHFEGNAQALRILSKARNNVEGYDVNLSYGVLNTLIKYPTNSIRFCAADEDIKKHKLGYFFAEREMMDIICKSTGTVAESDYLRHPLVYLMEAADDIAYATADLEDALKKGMFSLDQFIHFFDEQIEKIDNTYHQTYSTKLIDDLKQRLNANTSSVESDLVSFQKWMELVKKWLMYVAAYGFSKSYDDILNGTYKYDLFYDTNHQGTIKILKAAMSKFVYDQNEILKLELSARKIISSLLDDFIYAVLHWDIKNDTFQTTKTDQKYINIILSNYKEDYMCARTDNEIENLYLRFLMITDYISGMTDSFAKNLYQDLNGID